jgi:nucleoside-diphosphate-sugar epimerase
VKSSHSWNVLVTGGAGYVGSALVPKLLAAGHRVSVLDLFLYGAEVFDRIRHNPNLCEINGDLRDPAAVARALEGCDAVIHLACISNDPSFELNPALGKSINYDCFRPLVRAAKRAGVQRFVYASSSSVYGVKRESEVGEDLPLEPLTDYSKYKAMCEIVLAEERQAGFTTCTLRPATICGSAPRQRLDVVVNILTNLAVNQRRIKVFGGDQKRPNLHIDDMCEIYLRLLELPGEKIDGQVWNVGYENHTLMQLAEIVRSVVDRNLPIEVVPTDDHRSYQVSSKKIARDIGFHPARTIEDAVKGLKAAFEAGKLPDSLENARYFNIKMMQKVKLS